MPSFLSWLKTWWVVLAGFTFIIAAGVRVQYQVEQLIADKQVNIAQWKMLRDINGRLTTVETKTDPITQQSWEDWGRVKDRVQAHERYIQRHRDVPHR